MMSIKKLSKLYGRFKRDVSGNFGVMAAVTTLGLIGSTGLVIDTQRFYQHADKAQSVADAAGLAAANFIGNNDNIIPKDQEPGVYIEGQSYSARELGFPLSNGEDINFSVEYDQLNNEVRVTTLGQVSPIMLQLIGKETISSRKTSVVKYADPVDAEPASVLFVLDNSGSMWFDDKPLNPLTSIAPTDTVRRVRALQANVLRFNDRLASVEADTQTADNNFFIRSGLLTYQTTDPLPGVDNDGDGWVDEFDESDFLVNATPMEWDVLPYSPTIENLDPRGGTNSAPAIERAETIMNAEPTAHSDRGNTDPKRFVIFMSDGQNSVVGSDPTIWIAQAGTGLYRRFESQTVCTRSQLFSFRGRTFRFCVETGQVQREVFWDISTDGVQEGRDAPLGSGWEEGLKITAEDQETINTCNRLKDDDVTIYTIGFALQEGIFNTNEWELQSPSNTATREVTNDDLNRATALLQSCASSPETFLLATDSAQLDIAFNTIATDILENIIRLTN